MERVASGARARHRLRLLAAHQAAHGGAHRGGARRRRGEALRRRPRGTARVGRRTRARRFGACRAHRTCEPSRSAGSPCFAFTSTDRRPLATGCAYKTCSTRSPRSAGSRSGEVREGALRYAIQVRFDPAPRRRSLLESLPSRRATDAPCRSPRSPTIEDETGPAQVSREDVERRVTIQANVRGRDIASFVADAQRRVGREVRLPPRLPRRVGRAVRAARGATAPCGGDPARARPHLRLAVHELRRGRPAAIIFLNVPFAATGGVLALAARGMPFSISAAVGFIALFGVAVLNGLVLVSTARHHEERATTATRGP
jgi:hypothetical protein